MRILAFIPGEMADQLRAFPTLSALATAYPGSKIDVVASPSAIAAYQVASAVAEKIPFDLTARNSLADWGNLLGIVRDREYEIVIAPRPTLSLSLMLWLSGIPTRVTYANSPGAGLYTVQVPVPKTMTATADYGILQGLGIGGDCPELKVNLPKPALDWADGERQRLGLASGGYVLMYSPDAGYPVNSWDSILQDFQKKQPDLPVVWLQNRQNAELSAQIADRVPSLKLTRPKDLAQAIAMIAGANLVLAAEGEILQSAIAAKTFTLGLFGASDPAQVMPTGDRYLALRSPTGKLADIAPATVLERVWNN